MEDSDYLEEYHEKTLNTFLPVMVVMAIVCVLGILGNAFTIAFYGFVSRKSPTVFMITALACVDIIVCVLIVPNLAEMGVNVKYTNAGACKVMHFFGHWTIEASALILWFISIDRYRHVCCPFKSQVDYGRAKWAVGILILISFLLSIRDFANFDIIEFPVPDLPDNRTDILGHYCTTTDDPNYKISVTLFHAIDALVVVMVLVTLAVTYGRIIWTLKKAGFAATDSKQDHNTGAKKTTERGYFNDIKDESSSVNNETIADEPSSDNKQPSSSMTRVRMSSVSPSKLKKTEQSLTFMLFAASIVFGVCFIPYFVVKLGVRNYKSASQLELGAGIQLFLRFTYVNSFANPYIFCIFNPQFRRFIRRTVTLGRSQSDPTDTKPSSQSARTEETGTHPQKNG